MSGVSQNFHHNRRVQVERIKLSRKFFYHFAIFTIIDEVMKRDRSSSLRRAKQPGLRKICSLRKKSPSWNGIETKWRNETYRFYGARETSLRKIRLRNLGSGAHDAHNKKSEVRWSSLWSISAGETNGWEDLFKNPRIRFFIVDSGQFDSPRLYSALFARRIERWFLRLGWRYINNYYGACAWTDDRSGHLQ